MKFNNLIFDFDGVIIDSNLIRANAYRYIFSDFDDSVVNKIVEFHQLYTGLSRYEKIKYFYDEILFQEVSSEKIFELAQKYSDFCLRKLNKSLLIKSVVDFINNYSKEVNLHIASGSDDTELKLLLKKFKLLRFFKSVHGSPETKEVLIKNIVKNNNYRLSKTAMIGDSSIDYHASMKNDITFFGFNNKDFKKLDLKYLNEITELKSYL